jgi:ABC-2 type transport system permease protein
VLGLGRDTPVVANGTFFSNAILPHIGYQQASSCRTTATASATAWRRERMAARDDPAALANNYIGSDADWIRFDAVVSTSADQIAVAPGTLDSEWMAQGRHYFHYRMDKPILNFYTFQSARYEVRHDRWQDVASTSTTSRATTTMSTA